MQGNRSAHTKPELALRMALRKLGLPGYRLHWPVPGRPDIAYPGKRVAIFVNGCFWHRCNICGPHMPATHTEFWRKKFELTKERDARKRLELENAGWIVLTAWECQVSESALCVAVEVAQILRNRPRVRKV